MLQSKSDNGIKVPFFLNVFSKYFHNLLQEQVGMGMDNETRKKTLVKVHYLLTVAGKQILQTYK